VSVTKPDPGPLTTIEVAGQQWTVATKYAERFRGFLIDAYNNGLTPIWHSDGGYNPRFIAGTNTWSTHAYGASIDLAADSNRQNKGSSIDPKKAEELATKWGLYWGGHFNDPMHFEVRSANQGPIDPATLKPLPAPPTLKPDTTDPSILDNIKKGASIVAGTVTGGASVVTGAVGSVASSAASGVVGSLIDWGPARKTLLSGVIVAGGVGLVVVGAHRAAQPTMQRNVQQLAPLAAAL
jgi:D-alanyl-D-alanine carboxypeptidase